jgi:hypothetical protein
MSVVYGQVDGMIRARGRDYLKDLLVERLGFVEEAMWVEIPEAGHDDTLSLECFVGPMLDGLRRA